jgi:hypothetical protein
MKETMKIGERIERRSGYNRNPGCAIKIEGRIHAVLKGPDGQIKGEWTGPNIVTNAGRAHIIDRLQGAAVAICDWMAIGSGTDAAAAADTTLGTELDREQGTPDQSVDHYTDTLVVEFGPGEGTGTVAEVGRLNAASDGTLMGRSVYTSWTPASTIPKGAGDTLTMTYSFTYAAS